MTEKKEFGALWGKWIIQQSQCAEIPENVEEINGYF